MLPTPNNFTDFNNCIVYQRLQVSFELLELQILKCCPIEAVLFLFGIAVVSYHTQVKIFTKTVMENIGVKTE